MTPASWFRLKALFGAIFVLCGVVLGTDRLFPPPLDKKTERSAMVFDRFGKPLRAFPIEGGRWRFEANLEEIDPVFLAALLEVEDQRFYSHTGVDWIGMIRAAWSSARAGRIVSGGSTITMQTARMLEPRPRNVGSKLVEIIRAVQIESRMSKEEILELYLSLTPYGGNLEGIRAASYAYFRRAPNRLTDDQIALLIALPQSPEARRPDLREAGAIAGRNHIAQKLYRLGFYDARRRDEVLAASVPTSRLVFPMRAWHGAAQALEGSDGGDVRASLDRRLQLDIEGIARRYADQMQDQSVQIAILVVDTPRRAVRAHVGSVSRNRPGGWMDLTDQARSPGSTLKPFIYALAFDDGAATPATRILDLPKRFDSYQPENFDLSFNGNVSVAEALQHSLNVPAVLALDRVGPERFAASASSCGGKSADLFRREGRGWVSDCAWRCWTDRKRAGFAICEPWRWRHRKATDLARRRRGVQSEPKGASLYPCSVSGAGSDHSGRSACARRTRPSAFDRYCARCRF